MRPLARAALGAALVLAPGAVASAALAAGLRASLADCLPFWNDEVHYWNEIAAFRVAGFGGGYCVPNARPAAAAWTPFGCHGPGFPVAYGLPARVFGWHPGSGPLFNVAVLLLGSLAWLALARPSPPRLAAAVLLIGTFWPLAFYLPWTMQESLHAAFAFVLAGLATCALEGRRGARWFVPVACLASLVRLSWALVLVPWSAVAFAGLPAGRRAGGWMAVLLFVAALTVIWALVCAPIDSPPTMLLRDARVSPTLALNALYARCHQQLAAVLSPDAEPLQIWLRAEVAGVLLAAAVGAFAGGPRARPAHRFAALNLAVLLPPLVAFYFVHSWADFRLLAPHLLLSLLVLLSAGARRIVLSASLAQACAAGAFVAAFTTFQADRLHQASPDRVEAMRAALAGRVDFEPGAPRWYNTVLCTEKELACPAVGIPAGIGLSYMVTGHGYRIPPGRMRPPAAFILVPTRFGELLRREGSHLEPIAQTPLGTLYRNLDAPPEPTS